jgi:hypothetical protein
MVSQNRSLKMLALACLTVVPGAFVLAQASTGGQDEPELPPGWSMQDMQACMEAGTPGDHHAKLMKLEGTWTGTSEMWMAPDMPSSVTQTKWTAESVLDGRYLSMQVEGEIPRMGPFSGRGLAGYDNVSGEFVADWVDSMSTGIMRGTGEMSGDGKTLTWEYTYNCPINKKPATMREVMKLKSPSAMTVEMHCSDPKSGKEYKCMQVELTKGS